MDKDPGGRPEYQDEQYYKWYDLMATWLKAGNSLYYAMEKAGLLEHKNRIYQKYRSDDKFREKVDRLRATPGEIVNEVFYSLIEKINQRVKGGFELTRDELETLKHFSEKHRTAQPFFVSRVETAQVDPDKVGNILDNLEKESSDYGKLGDRAAAELPTTTD